MNFSEVLSEQHGTTDYFNKGDMDTCAERNNLLPIVGSADYSTCSPQNSSSEAIHPENKVNALLQSAILQRSAKRPRLHPSKLNAKSPRASESDQDEALDLSVTVSPLASPDEPVELVTSSTNKSKNTSTPVTKTPAVRKSKAKGIKCAQCEVVCETRVDLWRHKVFHIPAEFRLVCPQCPFVTEHRHHLQYHIQANHVMYKPFKCSICPYECINKSMLNSHVKCHMTRQLTTISGDIQNSLGPLSQTDAAITAPTENVSSPAKKQETLDILKSQAKSSLQQKTNSSNSNTNQEEDMEECKDQEKQDALSMTWSNHLETIIGEILKADAVSTPSKRSPPHSENTEETLEPKTTPKFDSSFLNADSTSSSLPKVISDVINILPLPSRTVKSEAVTTDDNDFGDIGDSLVNSQENNLSSCKRSRKGKPRKCFSEVEVPFSGDDKFFECIHCGILFRDNLMFEEHSRLHSVDTPFVCRLCGFVGEDSLAFFKHITTETHTP